MWTLCLAGLSPTGWKMIWSKMLTGLNTDEGFSADVH
jgi:hypothetical protein